MISPLFLLTNQAYGVAPSPSPTPSKVSPDQVSAGLLGFVVFAFLAGAAFLLWRSMNKQMRRVPESFDVVDGRSADPDMRRDEPEAGAHHEDRDDAAEPPSA